MGWASCRQSDSRHSCQKKCATEDYRLIAVLIDCGDRYAKNISTHMHQDHPLAILKDRLSDDDKEDIHLVFSAMLSKLLDVFL